jgi:hypothetical protein
MLLVAAKTRIWGFRPPVPPLEMRVAAPQTPLRMDF